MTHTTEHWTNWSGIDDPVLNDMVCDMAGRFRYRCAKSKMQGYRHIYHGISSIRTSQPGTRGPLLVAMDKELLWRA